MKKRSLHLISVIVCVMAVTNIFITDVAFADSLGGIGISLMRGSLRLSGGDTLPNVLLINHVISGSPAEKAGLRHNDAIMMIDGYSTEETGTRTNLNRLLGKVGTTVTLTIQKPNSSLLFDTRRILVKREEIIHPDCTLSDALIEQADSLWTIFYKSLQYSEDYQRTAWSNELSNTNTLMEQIENEPECINLTINTLATPYKSVSNALINLERSSIWRDQRDKAINDWFGNLPNLLKVD